MKECIDEKFIKEDQYQTWVEKLRELEKYRKSTRTIQADKKIICKGKNFQTGLINTWKQFLPGDTAILC